MGGEAEARAAAFEADVVCVETDVLDVSDSKEALEAFAVALLHQATDLIKRRFLQHRNIHRCQPW